MRRIPGHRDFIAGIALMIAGATAVMAQGAAPVQLTGGEWVVESVGGVSASGDRRARIAIAADGRVTGSGGCNRLMGRADINGETIRFGTLATTRMACAPAIMERERKLLDALATTRTYRIADTMLTLHDASSAEVARLTWKG
jgi:heat shock protein HslJ